MFIRSRRSRKIIRSLHVTRSWGLAAPNLTAIASFCQLQFGWNATEIARKFSEGLFLGIAIQSLLKPYDLHALLQAHVESGLSSDDDFPHSSVLRVLKTNITSDNHTLKKYKVKIVSRSDPYDPVDSRPDY
ncbi:hypothetical protein B0H14DRAFT_2919089 [Mycena olivaceomarginata]|nr:hypothetical protein B0H14DRAFT_2919089 [Mycena olivaceomarginata]